MNETDLTKAQKRAQRIAPNEVYMTVNVETGRWLPVEDNRSIAVTGGGADPDRWFVPERTRREWVQVAVRYMRADVAWRLIADRDGQIMRLREQLKEAEEMADYGNGGPEMAISALYKVSSALDDIPDEALGAEVSAVREAQRIADSTLAVLDPMGEVVDWFDPEK